jgi:hypothetical protein
LHGLIIINDCNQFGRLVQRHVPEGSVMAYLGQSNFRMTKLDLSKLDRYLDGLAI